MSKSKRDKDQRSGDLSEPTEPGTGTPNVAGPASDTPACNPKPPENSPETQSKPNANPPEGSESPNPLPAEPLVTDGADPIERCACNVVDAIAVAQAAIDALFRASPSTLCHECKATLAAVRVRIRQQYPVKATRGVRKIEEALRLS